MRLSRRTDYALRVLFDLTEHYGESPRSMTLLAERNDVPKPFLEHIMLDLKRQGWVESTAGRRGGYVLARPPEEITMGQVIRFFDGVLAPMGCVSITQYEPCSQEPRCRFRRTLLEVRNRIAGALDNATLAAVARNRPVAESEVFDGFIEGDGI